MYISFHTIRVKLNASNTIERDFSNEITKLSISSDKLKKKI